MAFQDGRLSGAVRRHAQITSAKEVGQVSGTSGKVSRQAHSLLLFFDTKGVFPQTSSLWCSGQGFRVSFVPLKGTSKYVVLLSQYFKSFGGFRIQGLVCSWDLHICFRVLGFLGF